jgi:hypothetical protein
MADGDRLGDHPAHRRAHDVRAVDPQVVEHADAVARHVGERVRRPAGIAARELHHGRGRGAVQPRRAPDVAVVVADHEESPVRQLRTEVLVPRQHLRAEAHDHEHRRVGRIPERLVTDVDLADAAKGLRHVIQRTRGGIALWAIPHNDASR